MKLPETETITKTLYLLGALIVLFLVYKIMTGLGIIKSKKKEFAKIEKTEAVEDLRTSGYFNPDYCIQHIFAKIGNNAADLYAEQLRKAMRGFGTNEETIFTVFGSIKNKGNISEIANRYYLKFKRNLRTDILNELTDKEKVELNNLIKKLPVL